MIAIRYKVSLGKWWKYSKIRLWQGFPWWFRLHVPNTGGMGSIPGQGTKIQRVLWQGKKKPKQNSSYLGVGILCRHVLLESGHWDTYLKKYLSLTCSRDEGHSVPIPNKTKKMIWYKPDIMLCGTLNLVMPVSNKIVVTQLQDQNLFPLSVKLVAEES